MIFRKQQIFTRKRVFTFVWVAMLLFVVYVVLCSNALLYLLFNQKMWVHRVDSIEKFNDVKDKFNGVEIDVVYLDRLNVFDVTHPPEPSIGLVLEEYFKSEKAKKLNFWLDFKNLDNSNYSNSLKRLNYLVKYYQINPQNIIVESPSVELLKAFEDEGFKVSYYLPWPGLYKLNPQEKNSIIQETTEYIKSYDLKYISSNYHDYSIMLKHFPNTKKLLWLTENEHKFNGIREQFYLYEILLDDKVDVLLVKYDSKTGNR